jgi:hypothetical protein
LAIGRNQSTVGLIVEGTAPSPETLIRLADLFDINPAHVFTMTGWLPENVGVNLTETEESLLADVRRLSPGGQRFLRGALQGLLQTEEAFKDMIPPSGSQLTSISFGRSKVTTILISIPGLLTENRPMLDYTYNPK